MGLLVAVAGLALSLCGARAQTPVSTAVKGGFKFPDYDPQNRLKSLITGKEMTPQGNDHFLITGLDLRTYRDDGQEELVVEAPQCVFDRRSRVATSPGELNLRSADGRFTITGQGFTWRQTNSYLILSNRVHTTVRRELLQPAAAARPGPANIAAPTNQVLAVFADGFEFDSKAGRAVYQGHVQATEPGMKLASERLTVHSPGGIGRVENIVAEQSVVIHFQGRAEEEIRAGGDKAIYTVGAEGQEQVELTGHPVWQTRQYEGKGDLLLLNPSRREFTARGHAFAKLQPATNGSPQLLPRVSATPSGTNTSAQLPLEIFSDEYEVKAGWVVFQGQVRANSGPGWKLASEKLTVKLAGSSNAFENIVAEKDVAIDFITKEGAGQATGQRAVYAPLADGAGQLELTGHPTWRTQSYSGRGDRLLVVPGRDHFQALGNASVRLPGGAAAFQPALSLEKSAPGPAAPAAATDLFVEIFSDECEFAGDSMIFRGHVRVNNEPEWILSCDLLEAGLSAAGNRLERIVAKRNVVFEQGRSRAAGEPGVARTNDLPWKLTCGVMTASVSTNGLAERIVAEQEVVMEQGTSRATGARADYAAATGVMELTGAPVLTTAELIISEAEVLIWDRRNNRMRGKGNYRTTANSASATRRGSAGSPP